jgi:hypothetical protein
MSTQIGTIFSPFYAQIGTNLHFRSIVRSAESQSACLQEQVAALNDINLGT